jgi:hypothetical protein
VELQLAAEGVGELAERVLVSGPCASERYLLHGHNFSAPFLVSTPPTTPDRGERNRFDFHAAGVITSTAPTSVRRKLGGLPA